MATTVEIGVYYTTPDAPYFRLNSATKGRLDNTSYRLAGAIFFDITDRVRSVNVSRGKNRELDRYSAGQVIVSLNNDDRYFDPLNTESFLYGSIIPRRQLRVRSGGFDQFVGVIDDWNYDYDVSGQSLASISASDNLVSFAQQSLTAGTATVETSGARVDAVLSQPSVAWPLDRRQVDAGNAVLNADVFDGNVLSYLQQVEASEQGQLFMTRDGDVRFIDGATAQSSTSWPVYATNLVTNPSMEASSGTVTVRTNLITNPSFEVDTTGWGNAGSTSVISRVTSDFYSGIASMQVACTTASVAITSTRPTVSANTTYTASVWVKATAGTTIRIELGEWTSGSVIVGTRTLGANEVATGSWQRLSATRAMGATAATADIVIRNVNAVTNTIFIDAALLEASPIVQDYFDGSVVSADADLTNSWSGTAHASTSLQRATSVLATSTQFAAAVQSSRWSSTGTKSLRIVPTGSSTASVVRFTVATEIGKSYTAKVKCRLAAPLTGTLNANSRRLVPSTGATNIVSSAQAPNEAGVTELTATFTANATSVLVVCFSGASAGNGDVWWDDLLVVEGTYTDSYFDGSTADTFRKVFYWTGTENASTSIAKQSEYIYFSDDDTGIPYTGATVSYGTELLYNQITVTYPAGTALANNTSSQSSYGIISTDINSVLSDSSQATTLADYLANKYGQPEYRFEAIQINLLGISGDQANSILQTELGDIATIRFTPNGVGSPIERVCIITSIKQSIGIDSHIVSLGFTSIPFSSLVLDDYGFGILDVNTLSI